MKFPHRAITLGIALTLAAIYFLVGHLHELNHRKRLPNYSAAPTPHVVIPNRDVCRFADQMVDGSGVHTEALFGMIGKPPKPDPVGRNEPVVNSRAANTGPEPLRAFVIPHSHNDPGWLKTLHGYYRDSTKTILDSMVAKLTKYEDMTFVWSESVFLAMWWNDIDDKTKAQVKRLIKRGQLELVTGGWVDPDEATTHYHDMVDELMEGHRWLDKHLGVRPKVYWAPDPFGYSATMPYLVQRAGMSQMVILRIHDDVKTQMRDQQNLEFLWRQSWDDSMRHTQLFTHMLPYSLYSIKHSCGPDPGICLYFDFAKSRGWTESRAPRLTDHNIRTYSKHLVDQLRAKSQHYRQNVVIFPLGDDFRYDRPSEWDEQYRNFKWLMRYINNNRNEWNMNVSFGTPSDYFKALADQTYHRKNVPPTYPTLYGDFYPYMDHDNDYWTGFYTTRPFWKQLAREVQADLRGAEILQSLAGARAQYDDARFSYWRPHLDSLDVARQSLALFQHHDAVTGTSKPNVVIDYGSKLWHAKRITNRVRMAAASYLLSGDAEADQKDRFILDLDYKGNEDTRKKMIPVTEKGTKVIFFNSLGHTRRELVRICVNTLDIKVIDQSNGKAVISQILPNWSDNPILDDYMLAFYVDIPAFGFSTYNVTKIDTLRDVNTNGLAVVSTMATTVPAYGWVGKRKEYFGAIEIENDHLIATFDEQFGLLKSLNVSGKTTRCSVEFLSYSSRSGAYIFRPMATANGALFDEPSKVFVTRGPLVSEVRAVWPHLVHTSRIYHDSSAQQSRAVEFENRLDMGWRTKLMMDKEIIMRLHTSVRNADVFYTDLNGFQMRRRQRMSKFKIAGNYYPMTTMAYLQDRGTRLSILCAQSHGVSSLTPGWFEIMLDRKMSSDDQRGLGEGVRDNKLTSTRFLLLIEHGSSRKDETSRNSYPSLLATELSNAFLYPTTTFYQRRHDRHLLPTFSPLKSQLPCDFHLVNLKTMPSAQNEKLLQVVLVLHRTAFQCQYPSQMLKCSAYNDDLKFDDLFKDLKIASVKERSLTLMYAKKNIEPQSTIELQPMDISTYLLTFR